MTYVSSLKPLGHDLDLDNPDDVDWLVEYSKEAKKVIDALESERLSLEKKLEAANRIANDYKDKWHRAIDAWEELQKRLAVREKSTL